MSTELGKRPSHILKNKTGPDDPELQETLTEAFEQISADDLLIAADQLVVRHKVYLERFGDPDKLWDPSKSEKIKFFKEVSYSQKQTKQLYKYFTDIELMPLVKDLLYSGGSTGKRITNFVAATSDLDERLSLELSTGILHHTFPQKNWLWTRWMWEPAKTTGILPLVAGGTHNLEAETLEAGYANVGSISAMSASFAEGTGLLRDDFFEDMDRLPFAVDVFLASSYTVYLYGVTSWRLSREFNSLLPPLPDLMRKLLGMPKQQNEEIK